MIKAYRTRSVDWKPSPVVALATSDDGSKVAAARDDASLEIWLVSPGSIGWHHQLTIHGDLNSRISSLVWCRTGSKGLPGGRLFSSSIDGSISEWDLFDLRQKIVLQSIGVSIWQMAVSPDINQSFFAKPTVQYLQNGHMKSDDSEDDNVSEIEDETDSEDVHRKLLNSDRHVAIACDNGTVQLYTISDSDGFMYYKSLPRVSGRVLSVVWAQDAKKIYSGTSDGMIRCWDAILGSEIYRSTVGLGGLGCGAELCVWSLLSLSSGTLVSADSSGTVQFWNGDNGTLLQAHSNHKGDVYTLAASPSHNRVFSAGADGQVILYKHSTEVVGPSDNTHSSEMLKKWTYIGYVRAHTHDVRALTVAVPISHEDSSEGDTLLDKKGGKLKRARHKKKPVEFSYNKWAHLGVPMLISAGDDTKLFAYSANEFTKFSPHDICPTPQRVPIQLASSPSLSNGCLLLVQASSWLDILCTRIPHASSGHYGGFVKTDLLARVKSKGSRKIICSAFSSSGELFAYSDHIRPSLFEISQQPGKNTWAVNKKKLPLQLPSAHSMVFSSDSSRLMISGHDKRIHVVDLGSAKLLHTFIPCRKDHDEDIPVTPCEPPITKMFSSSDGQWLAAVNCFGDVYIFNLETLRQHWFISRLNGAAVTAAGFPPLENNVLIVTTSLNEVYGFDVEAKQLGEWSRKHMSALPKRYQEFPGEVVGLSFSPSSSFSLSRAPSTIVYSSRAMCTIDFGQPVDKDDELNLMNSQVSELRKSKGTPNAKKKRRLSDALMESKLMSRKNFEFAAFKDPVLFVGHFSENSVLVVDKPWLEVIKGLETAPIHRHIFGS